jgi:pimeloyl-ACP methyl ester carboxylesterase
MTQNIAKTAKGPIEYRLEGSGPIVVVLNGWHCSRDSRLSHERLAQSGFSVLVPSRPGYDSTPSEVGKIAQEAADTLAFALRHPARTHKFILESAMATKWDQAIKTHSRIGFGRAVRVTWAVPLCNVKVP